MADITILVCACGMRLRAAGATPGRVGKCPACGGLLRVPDAPTTAPSVADTVPLMPTTVARPSTYSPRRVRSPRLGDPPAPRRYGGIRVPPQAETRFRDSLLYPLWGETGVALLLLMPPAFWFATLPIISIGAAWTSGNPLVGAASLMGLIPSGLMLFPVVSFVLLYFGRVITASAIGEVHHPRWPDWDPADMLRGIGRWLWALLVGGFLGGFPSVLYWLYCGDVDLFDAIILFELAGMGAVYGQVALLASILHDDPLGAHPLTVLRAIRQLGWRWLSPAATLVSFTIMALLALSVVLQIQTPGLVAVAYWGYWVGLLYGLMVVLRRLGLFYHRHARALGWFGERPKWGG